VSILYIESIENRGDENLLAKTDCGASAGAGTIFVVVDFDAKELARRAEIGDLVIFREPGLDLNLCIGSVFQVQYRDVVNVQKHQITIAAELEVGLSQGLCELERQQEGVDIVVP